MGPWVRLAARAGYTVRWWRCDPCSGASYPAALEQLLGPDTRVVVLTHVSNLLRGWMARDTRHVARGKEARRIQCVSGGLTGWWRQRLLHGPHSKAAALLCHTRYRA